MKKSGKTFSVHLRIWRQNQPVGPVQDLRVRGHNGLFTDSGERAFQREKITYTVIDDRCHQRTPLVEGISSMASGSIATAFLRALETALKTASAMWCEFFPASCLM